MARKLTKKNTKVQKVVKKVKVTGPASKQAAAASTVKLPTGTYIEGIGRRKTAIARVRIYPGGGDLLVNGQAMGQYFGGIYNASQLYLQPFRATDTATQFAVSAKISGSGIHAQLEALIHGISRALVAHNPDYRLALKELGFLTRDDRMKETRKIGTGGKARRKRQSPKR